MLFWNSEAGFSKRFTDESVCVKIDLPVVVVVAVRPVSLGRFFVRRKVASCCRNAGFSAIKWAFRRWPDSARRSHLRILDIMDSSLVHGATCFQSETPDRILASDNDMAR